MSTEQFIQDLVRRFPRLQGTYDAHLYNMGELLSHGFFQIGSGNDDGITDLIVRSYLGEQNEVEWREALAFLDEYYAQGDRDVFTVIVTSFLDYLPYPNQPGFQIMDELSASMRAKLQELRPYLT